MSRRRIPVDGCAAFVSGAGSGIGAALARRLAAHGCPVAIVDQDEAGLRRTSELISGPVLARTLDVRDAEAQLTFAAEVAEWAPAPLGIVFNNAGVTTYQGVAESAVEDDEWVMDVNFGGVVNGVRAFLPILQRQDSGVLVNTSSVFGLIGWPRQSAYCASKFAVRGFTECLRLELRGTGVRAITVHPGAIRTNILRNARYNADPVHGEMSQQDAARQFDSLARTTPEQAAKIIHRGVKSGRSRILVGADAHALDALARILPTHYWAVLERLEPLAERLA